MSKIADLSVASYNVFFLLKQPLLCLSRLVFAAKRRCNLMRMSRLVFVSSYLQFVRITTRLNSEIQVSLSDLRFCLNCGDVIVRFAIGFAIRCAYFFPNHNDSDYSDNYRATN